MAPTPRVYAIRGKIRYPIKNAAIYVRISTARPNQTRSMDIQTAKLVEYVKGEWDLSLKGIYTDIGSGRSAESRKELRRLLDDCKKKEIDVIVTKSISRFGRNTVDTLNICRELRKYGVDVYFQSENIHSLGDDGELTLTLASAVAESESYEKSTNIKWGLEKSAQNPDSKIFSRVCYGYVKDDEGNLVIDEEQAEIVRLVFQMYLEGSSVQRIKDTLEQRGIPAPSGGASWPKRTIEKMLCNEKYVGNVLLYKSFAAEYPEKRQIENIGQHQKIVCEGHHPAIITREVFDDVQCALAKRQRKKKAPDDR